MNHDNFTEVTSEDAPRFFYAPHPEWAWATGYNTCLKRTNANQLIQCLIELKGLIDDQTIIIKENTDDDHSDYIYKRITNAIKKATDQNK